MGYDRKNITPEEARKAVEEKLGKELADKAIPLFQEAYPQRPLIDLLGMDYMFRQYTLDYVNRRVAAGSAPIWDYMFNLDGPMYGGQLPPHCADIPFVFHTTDLVPSTQEQGVTQRLERQIFETVMAFVRTGNPNNPEIPQWDPAGEDGLHTLVVDKQTQVRDNFDGQLVETMSGALLDGMVQGILSQMARKPTA